MRCMECGNQLAESNYGFLCPTCLQTKKLQEATRSAAETVERSNNALREEIHEQERARQWEAEAQALEGRRAAVAELTPTLIEQIGETAIARNFLRLSEAFKLITRTDQFGETVRLGYARAMSKENVELIERQHQLQEIVSAGHHTIAQAIEERTERARQRNGGMVNLVTVLLLLGYLFVFLPWLWGFCGRITLEFFLLQFAAFMFLFCCSIYVGMWIHLRLGEMASDRNRKVIFAVDHIRKQFPERLSWYAQELAQGKALIDAFEKGHGDMIFAKNLLADWAADERRDLNARLAETEKNIPRVAEEIAQEVRDCLEDKKNATPAPTQDGKPSSAPSGSAVLKYTVSKWVTIVVSICLLAGYLGYRHLKTTDSTAPQAKAPAVATASAPIPPAPAPTPTPVVQAPTLPEPASTASGAVAAEPVASPPAVPVTTNSTEAAQPVPQSAPASALVTTTCSTPETCFAVLLESSSPRKPEVIQAVVAQLATMNTAKRGDRKAARALNQQGLEALQKMDYKVALELLSRAAEADPADVEIASNRAYAIAAAGYMGAALPATHAALLLDPKRTTNWIALAKVFAFNEDVERATRALLLGFEFSGDQAKTVAFFTAKSQDEADPALRDAYRRALQQMPSTPSKSL